MIFFKGKGEHSVHQLEQLVIEQGEALHEQQVILQEYRKALELIAAWDLPYGAAYGSNGEREFVKDVANKALNKASKFKSGR